MNESELELILRRFSSVEPRRYHYRSPNELNVSDRRDWERNQKVSRYLDDSWSVVKPFLVDGIEWQKQNTQGRTHKTNIERWERLIESDDIEGLRHHMTTLDDMDGVYMRQVSPVIPGLQHHLMNLVSF